MKEVKSIKMQRVDPEVVDILKELLACAETGELSGIIFIDKYTDGRIGHGWAGKTDTQMIGEIECVKHHFISTAFTFDEVES